MRPRTASIIIRCRVCSFTEVDACDPPCGWADTDLCTTCGAAAETIAQWMHAARKANLSALLREAKARSQEWL